MTTINKAHATIDLDDCVRAGGVRAALQAWCDESDMTAGGVVGPAFGTSGPGSGWSRTHDEDDFARRALAADYGAAYYLDTTDGRLAQMVDTEDEGGETSQEVEWSDDSVVCLLCPEIDDAIAHPEMVAEMAQAVIDYHGPRSDRAEWKKLIQSIRDAADALADIDLDDLA